jgi:signal peptidase I
MPGDTIEVRNNALFIDGKQMQDPENMQLNYFVETNGAFISDEQFRLLNVSHEDRVVADNNGYFYRPGNGEIVAQSVSNLFPRLSIQSVTIDGRYNPVYRIPLTKKSLETLQRFSFVKSIHIEPDNIFNNYSYPVDYETGWTRDNYGPLWIPKKGETIVLNEKTLGLYSRCIVNYEGNTLRKDNGNIYLNGVLANSYTFKYDYYFMMGDNRHNSADSRSWGFVPEDHIVGKPILVWLSLDKDRSLFKGGIRWNRLFKMVHSE